METMRPVETAIKTKLRQALKPEHMEVVNESGKHNVPPGSESHFKVTLVTSQFENRELIDRHREINRILEDELNGKIHALSLQTLTPDEWHARNRTSHQTPPCLGGEKSQDKKK